MPKVHLTDFRSFFGRAKLALGEKNGADFCGIANSALLKSSSMAVKMPGPIPSAAAMNLHSLLPRWLMPRPFLSALAILVTGLPIWAADELVPKLIRQLGSDSFAQREQAAKELVAVGEAALPALREAAKAADPEIAKRAKGAIGAIETKRVPSLVVQLKDMDPAKRLLALSGIFDVLKAGGDGQAAVPELILRLEDPESLVGMRSALALGAIGSKAKAAIPILGKKVLDPKAHSTVRRASLQALGGFGPEPAAIEALLEIIKSGSEFAAIAKSTMNHLNQSRP